MPLFWIVFIHHACLCNGFCRKRPGAADNRVAIENLRRFWLLMVLRRLRIRRQRERATRNCPRSAPGFVAIAAFRRPLFGDMRERLAYFSRSSTSPPEHYDAKRVRDVLMCRFGQISRSLPRELRDRCACIYGSSRPSGLARRGLSVAVPTVRSWRLASLPRYTVPDEIERVVPPATPRPQWVCGIGPFCFCLPGLPCVRAMSRGLRLGDIDGPCASHRLRESKRSVGLPLPQDAGEAVLAYIEQARPQVDEEKLFLRVVAPHRPLSRSSVISGIVCRALNRAGIHNIPSRGAHLSGIPWRPRWCAAEASLEEIGTLLRHRSRIRLRSTPRLILRCFKKYRSRG